MKDDGLYGSILKCVKRHAIVDIRSGIGRPHNLKSGVIYVGGGLHIVAFASYGYWGAYSGPGHLKTISPFDLDEINTWNFEDVQYSEQEYANFFDFFVTPI
ncbi:10213_t:CDS:2 [Entrophospora sp. SA101]|nr:10213_t:CDS:2 [Entrophospora sp. SA101]